MESDLDFDTTLVAHSTTSRSEAAAPAQPNAVPTPEPAAASKVPTFDTGDCLLERYIVLDKLGQGMMGAVYHCHDKVAQVDVAVKSMPPGTSRDPEKMEQVRRNFKLVHGLRHENIVGLRTLEQDAQSGEFYLVMDYAQGMSLGRWMRKFAREEHRPQRLKVLEQIAAALDHAHEHDIIHRDIKPDNVMVDDRGHVYVLDFGIAAETYGDASEQNMSGTPRFKAPEQWIGDTLTPAADQYALGGIAFNMIAGEPPFDASTKDELRTKVLKSPVPKIAKISEAENLVLQKVLSKEPNDRYPSCGAFVAALRHACEERFEEQLAAPAPVADASEVPPSETLLQTEVSPADVFPDSEPEDDDAEVDEDVEEEVQEFQAAASVPRKSKKWMVAVVMVVGLAGATVFLVKIYGSKPELAGEEECVSAPQEVKWQSVPLRQAPVQLPEVASQRVARHPRKDETSPAVKQAEPVNSVELAVPPPVLAAYDIAIRVNQGRKATAENAKKIGQELMAMLPKGVVLDQGEVTEYHDVHTNEKGFKLRIIADDSADERAIKGFIVQSVRPIIGLYRITCVKSGQVQSNISNR